MDSKIIVKERNSNIELLRIILICMVIMLHYNNADIGGAMFDIDNTPRINFLFLSLLDSFSACAVNCFFLITGWFYIKKKEISFRKPIHILFVFCACKFLTYILSLILGFKTFNVKNLLGSLLPNSYFALIYVSLLLITPFINLLITKLKYSDFKKLIIVSICLFSIYPSITDFLCSKLNISYQGMSNISINGNDWGYNFVNFLLMYIIGAFLRCSEENDLTIYNHKKRFDILIYLLASICIFILSFVNSHATNYCNLLVIIQAVAIFQFFSKFVFHCKFVNWIAKSVWGIYSIHLVIIWFWDFFNITEYVQKSFWLLLSNIIVTVGAVFFFCLLLEKIYECIFIPIYKISNKISILNRELKVDGDD